MFRFVNTHILLKFIQCYIYVNCCNRFNRKFFIRMSNSTGLIVVVILLLLIINTSKQGFEVNREQMFNDILENKHLFSGEQYITLKRKFSWMDAGIYMDVRHLIRNGRCNKDNLDIIFRKTV